MLLQPGGEATLSVRATGPAGAPLVDAAVVFTSPENGPSGIFPDSAAIGQRYVRATTDSDGVAQARFRAGSQIGPVPVEAHIENTDAVAAFAITILAEPTNPGSDPPTVRRAVIDALVATSESDSVRVHGPFWLPAGSRVLPAERWSVFNLQVPTVLAADSWILWIDEDAQAEFAHEVRYVVADASQPASQAVPAAKVSLAEWWPEVYLPLSIDPISLYAPSAANEQLAADLEASVAPLAPERVFDAPADACAVVIYGPSLTGAKKDTEAFRDYLTRSEKVAPGNIFLNEQDFGGASFNRTATKEDLKRLVDRAAAADCNKLFLLIRAHGSRGMGAGISLRDPDQGGGKILPYPELIEILAPFRGKQLCALTHACFSGQFLLWLEGQGFSGEAISSADLEHSSYTTASGGLFFREWLAALENSDADVDGGGVSFTEAHTFVVANTTNTFVSEPMPLGGAINPDGTRRMELPDLKIFNAGDTRLLTITRPPGTDLSQPFIVNLSALGPSIATIPSDAIVIPPFTPSLPVPITGNDCGEMQYQASGSDGVHSYIGRAGIQVNDFKVQPDPIIIPAPGQSVTVTVTRFGFWATTTNNASQLTVTARDTSKVTPPANPVPIPNDQLEVTFSVTGVSPGETLLDIRDQNSFSRKSVKVIVLGAPEPPPTGCPLSGQAQVTTSAVSGLQHIDFTGNPSSANLTFRTNDGVLTIQSNRNQFPPATGVLNLSDCTFNAQGVALQPVAGFSNVQGDYSGQINSSDFGRINLRIRIGIGGEFPDRQPVVWNAQGPFTRNDQPSSNGGLFIPPQRTVSWAGGRGSVIYSPSATSSWTAATNDDWITLDPPASGVGPGAVHYHVSPNGSPSSRQGTIMLGPDAFPIDQDGTSSSRPVLNPGGVLNGMTFQTGTGPATWTTLTGSFPAPNTRIWDSSDFNGAQLPTSLDGLQVTADGLPMGFYFISANQLNVLNNDTGHLGLNAFQVTGPAGASDEIFAYRREYEPELFRFNPQGGRYIAAVHPNGDLVGPPDLFQTVETREAQPDGTFIFFGSGFGDTNPPTSAAELIPQPTLLADQPVFLIGGRLARVRFAGRVSSGFEQFNIDVPPLLPEGDHRVEGFVNGRPLQTDAWVTIGESSPAP